MSGNKSMRMAESFARLQQAISAEGLSSRFQTELRRIWKQPIVLSEFSIPRVFPGRDGTFTIQYRMKVDGMTQAASSTLILGGHLLAEGSPVPSYVSDNSEHSFFLDDLRLALPLFPFDPELANLKAAYHSPDQLSVFERAVADSSESCDSSGTWTSELLAYRMGKRCVFRVCQNTDPDQSREGTRTEIILKLLRPKKIKRALDAINFLRRHGFTSDSVDRISVPSLLAADESAGIFLTDKAPGHSLHDLTGDSKFGDSCEATALALIKLHNLPAGDFPALSPKTHLFELSERVRQAGNIFPEFSPLFQQAWNMIETGRSLLSEPFELTCIHTDFYDKQLFIHDGFVTILDNDSLSMGDPAMDAGNFIAHLHLRALQEPSAAVNILRGLESFKKVYFSGCETNYKRARYWEGAALLRLAALYSLRPKWQKLTVKILNRTIESLSTDNSFQTVGKRG